MRTLLLLLALTMNVPAVSSASGTPRDTFDAFNDAFREGDIETVEDGIAASYLHSNSGAAPLDRETWLTWYTALASRLRAGASRYDRYETSEIHIQVQESGLGAVITARVRAELHDEGQLRPIDVRTTQVWVVEAGRWKRAAFHDTPVVAPRIGSRAIVEIQRAITQDEILGSVRNEACHRRPIADVIADYVEALDLIDLDACPSDFAHALRAHRDAWHASIPFFTGFAELRGEMHEVFESIRARDATSRTTLEAAEARIWGTWSDVEKSVERHQPKDP
jgi:ketosteroid isomerase-like protein